MSNKCIAYTADGKICGKTALWPDPQRGGMVCTEHRPRLASTMLFNVNYRYTREELNQLFQASYNLDVEKGSTYDGRGMIINFWTEPWTAEARGESRLIGCIYVDWSQDTICLIRSESGFNLDDVLKELGNLELKAFGRKVHGK